MNQSSKASRARISAVTAAAMIFLGFGSQPLLAQARNQVMVIDGKGNQIQRNIPAHLLQSPAQLDDQAAARLGQADSLYYRGQVDKALEMYEELAAKAAPGQDGGVFNGRAALKLAEHYSSTGEYTLALPHLRNLLEQGAEAKFRMPRLQIAMLLIKTLSGLGARQEAIQVIDTLMASGGGYGYGLLLKKAELYEEMGDLEGSLACLEEMLQTTGMGDQVLPRLFALLKKMDRLGKREEKYLQYMKENPSDTRVPAYLARLYMFQDKLSEAAGIFEGILRKQELANQTPDPDFLLDFGRICASTGNHARAVELLQRALVIRPGHQVTATSLFDSLLAIGRKEDAAASLREAIVKSTSQESAGEMAAHLSLKGMKDQALEAYREIRGKFQAPNLFFQEMMAIYGSLGRFDQVVEEMVAIVSNQPYRLDNLRDIFMEFLTEYREQSSELVNGLLARLPAQPASPMQGRGRGAELFSLGAYGLKFCGRYQESIERIVSYSLGRGDQGYSLLTFGRELLDSSDADSRKAGIQALETLVEKFSSLRSRSAAEGVLELARIHLSNGEPARALELLTRTASNFVGDQGLSMHLLLARAEIMALDLGMGSQALTALEGALEQRGDLEQEAMARSLAARCLMLQGDFTRAGDHLDQAVPVQILVDAGNTGRSMAEPFADALYLRALQRIARQDFGEAATTLEVIVRRATGLKRATDALFLMRMTGMAEAAVPGPLASDPQGQSLEAISDEQAEARKAAAEKIEKLKLPAQAIRLLLEGKSDQAVSFISENWKNLDQTCRSALLHCALDLMDRQGNQSVLKLLRACSQEIGTDTAAWALYNLARKNLDFLASSGSMDEARKSLLAMLSKYQNSGYGVPGRRILGTLPVQENSGSSLNPLQHESDQKNDSKEQQ